MRNGLIISLVILIVIVLNSCRKELPLIEELPQELKTENVVIIVMDGPRYMETWGEPNKQYIPYLSNDFAPKGIVNNNFYNNGFTWTNPGHLAMTGGYYYNLHNNGQELPPYPTIFQYFNKKYPNKKSAIIASKDKLEVLTNTVHLDYNNQYLSFTNCGNSGLGTGYRKDSVTHHNALQILDTLTSNLTLINFREPDSKGHENNWNGYLANIPIVESYIKDIVELLDSHPFYKDNTTVFITNDHGRHLDENGGFQNHGDSCEGCRHIMFFAKGPDFKQNVEIDTRYELIDIAETTSYLLDFELPQSEGVVMTNLFKLN